VVTWAWDQGRGTYFDYAAIQKQAQALVQLDGTTLSASPDMLRAPLEAATGLPFAPASYTVWRNYSRIFKVLLLASEDNGVVKATDAARMVDPTNPNAWTLDDYFAFLIPRTYMTPPARQGYDPTAEVVYPMCAVFRYLLEHGAADLDRDVFGKIIGNGCTGSESLQENRALTDTGYRASDDAERRQVREMLAFFAEAAYLDFDGTTLTLLVGPAPQSVLSYLWQVSQPIGGLRKADSNDEVQRLGMVTGVTLPMGSTPTLFPLPQSPAKTSPGSPPPSLSNEGYESDDDREFTEGKKRRVEHLKTERSEKLKKEWAKQNGGAPTTCEMCLLAPMGHYPWITSASIHLHHVLPLSSSVHTTLTAIRDVVPLCGTCHGAVHMYYRKWLDSKAKDDFADKAEARLVYDQAKALYQP
jgi:hypothetical protein